MAALRGDFATLDLSRAAEDAWRLVQRLNRLVEERAPWTLAKDPERAGELDQTLFALAEGLRAVAIMLWPVIPGSSERILAALGQDPARRGAGVGGVGRRPRRRDGRARRPALPARRGGGGVVDTHAHLDSCEGDPARSWPRRGRRGWSGS